MDVATRFVCFMDLKIAPTDAIWLFFNLQGQFVKVKSACYIVMKKNFS